MENPKISIIIPTYCRVKALSKVLNRLSHQAYQSLEIIIVDDSPDPLSADSFDCSPNVKYHNRGAKLGVSSARNLGAQLATGEYLIFLDDDDEFSSDWLTDFADAVKSAVGVQLVVCGMKAVFSGSGGTVEKNYVPGEEEAWRLIIPGCWCISRDLFLRAGGYDEKLNYGENTELFFRIGALNPTTIHVPDVNFIYIQSVDGGSKHLLNMISANQIILEKHSDYLARNPHVRFLYTQIIGVAYMRLRRFKESRHYLLKAYFLKPQNLLTMVRFFIACFPVVARRIYPEIVFR